MQADPSPAFRLTVSIVVHDSPLDMLWRVLDSLERAAHAAQRAGRLGAVDVDVVDNASAADYRARLRDGLARRSRDGFFRVHGRFLARNGGFGAGHNAALAHADSDVHLVLNPDAELAGDALAAGLARLAAAADIALLSPRVCAPDGAREYLCKRRPSVLVLFLRGFAPAWLQARFRERLERYEMRDVCAGDTPVEVEIASGCFMLARTAALRAVGGFDEDFFLYFEDFDLSLRLRGQGRLEFYPPMCIVHHGGDAARKGWRHVAWFCRSALRFFGRHGWRWV